MDASVVVGWIKLASDFLAALLIPVIIAAPLVAILIDQVLKRMPFWKDGYAGPASLGLNMVFSAGLFIAARMGAQGEYEQAISISIYALPIVVRLVVGLWASVRMHNFYKTVGVGKSVTEETLKTQYPTVGALG